MEYIILYFFVISFISLSITVIDKLNAIKGKWRVSEKTLFVFAILGGSVIMYLTMQLIRHKTQKISFVFGIPFIFAIQCVIVYYVFSLIS